MGVGEETSALAAPLGTEVELEDTIDSDTEANLAELDAIPEEAEA